MLIVWFSEETTAKSYEANGDTGKCGWGGGSLRDKTLACRGARTQIHMVEEEPTNTGRLAWEEPRENRADNDAAKKQIARHRQGPQQTFDRMGKPDQIEYLDLKGGCANAHLGGR